MCARIYVHKNGGASRGQRCCVPLELKLQVIVNFLTLVLKFELKSSGSALHFSKPFIFLPSEF